MNTGGRNRRHARGCLKLCFYFRAKGYICKMARLGFVIADPRAGPTIKTNYLTIQDVLFPHGPGCHAATSSSTTIKQIKFTSELILNHLERLGWSQKITIRSLPPHHNTHWWTPASQPGDGTSLFPSSKAGYAGCIWGSRSVSLKAIQSRFRSPYLARDSLDGGRQGAATQAGQQGTSRRISIVNEEVIVGTFGIHEHEG